MNKRRRFKVKRRQRNLLLMRHLVDGHTYPRPWAARLLDAFRALTAQRPVPEAPVRRVFIDPRVPTFAKLDRLR